MLLLMIVSGDYICAARGPFSDTTMDAEWCVCKSDCRAVPKLASAVAVVQSILVSIRRYPIPRL